MKVTGYRKVAVIDNFQEELWAELEIEFGLNTCAQVAEFVRQKVGHDDEGEVFDELPVCDGVIDDDGDFVFTYGDIGMCEQVILFKKIWED